MPYTYIYNVEMYIKATYAYLIFVWNLHQKANETSSFVLPTLINNAGQITLYTRKCMCSI